MRILTFPRLALILTIGLAAMGAYVLSASAQETQPEIVAVDANSDGNSPNALGETDVCSELAVGEERTIDIIVRGLPEVVQVTDVNDDGESFIRDDSGGIEGFQFNIRYDEEYVIITEIDLLGQLMGLDPDSNVIDLSDDVLSDSGLMSIASVDFATDAAESGDGVLARLTVRGVSAGTSNLQLTDIEVAGAGNFEYTIEAVQNALLAVGIDCREGTTPPPSTVTAQPSPAPSGDETPPAPSDTDAPDTGDGEVPDGSPTTSNGDAPGGSGDVDGNDWVVPVVIAVAITLVAVTGGVYALRRRGSTS